MLELENRFKTSSDSPRKSWHSRARARDGGAPPPQESWGLDPLFFANVKVTAGEVVGGNPALVPAEGTNRGVHFFHGRPTKRYELMGHVVTLIVRDNKTIFTRT